MNDNSQWWTAPAEADNGNRIIVTGRKDINKFRDNKRFNIRIEIKWEYRGDSEGMPTLDDALLMEKATELLQQELAKDPIAVLTGIFTGDNQRDWIFYTLSTHIFNKKLNEALKSLPLLPLTIYAENDPLWQQYDEMSLAEIKMD